MNRAIFVAKVIKDPVHLIYNENPIIEIVIQFPSSPQKNLIKELTLILWGEHRENFLKYYKTHDYLIIEGILTSQTYKTDENLIKIIAQRVYPFLLYG